MALLATAAHGIVALASLLAPAGERAEFQEEWTAELEWSYEREAATPIRRDARLARRAAGAFLHALWLRRQQWSLDMFWQDVKYAARVLRGRPSFTLVAIATLALGIGANTAIFSIVYGVLLKPLPFRSPERLVQIWETNPIRNWTDATASPANLLDWKRRNRVFDDIAFSPGMDDRTPIYMNGTLTSATGEPERLRGVQVSTNYFQVLGVGPVLGRGFAASEEIQGAPRVAILSHAAWRAHFQGDPGIVGRDITLNTRPYRVIGVMPAGFGYPAADTDVYTPYILGADMIQVRRPHYLRPVARLKDAVTIAQARADLQRIAAELEREYPDTNTKMGADLGPLHEWVVGGVRRPLLVFLAAVALVLLVACANLANLLLARAAGRSREFAIRTALGGAGWRLVRQLLTECSMLAVAGGVLGVFVAQWTLDTLIALSPAGVPRLSEVSLDARMLIFVAGLTSVTALLCGLLPAWQSARVDTSALREGSRATGARFGMRRVLVVGQVAASVALIVCAGLLLRSFERLQSVPPGFDPDRVLTLKISLPGAKYSEDSKAIGFFEEWLVRARRLPGVAAAGGSTVLGLEGEGWTGDLFVDGRPDFHARELRHKDVTEGYFAAVGLPIMKGRDFASSDDAAAPAAVVVNESFVRAYFREEDPIGRRISYSYDPQRRHWQTIIGVVKDEKQNALAEPVHPEVYGTHRQNATTRLALAVRSSVDPASLVPALRAELRAQDPVIAMYEIRTLSDVVTRSVARERFTAWIVGVFALLAFAIAAVGVYGVVWYSVSNRTREIGIRVALGSTRRGVMQLVLGETFTLLVAGLVGGMGLALAAGGALRSLLFETAPTDVVTYVAACGLLAIVGVLASYVPTHGHSRSIRSLHSGMSESCRLPAPSSQLPAPSSQLPASSY